MRPVLPAVFLACTAAVAADPDAMNSADCSASLTQLQAQEERQRDAIRIDDAMRARWQALRLAAAQRCLGGDGSLQSPAQHLLRTPIAVTSVTTSAPRSAAPSAIAAAAPLHAARPALTLLACDPVGCTASDGARYLRTGPGLVGPKGLCSVQGPLLQCP